MKQQQTERQPGTPGRDLHSRYSDYWMREYRNQPYYNEKYEWSDFGPAYEYAFEKRGENPTRRFEDVESDLEAGWETAKGKSRLLWNEAKQAVRSGWHAIERLMPGDADRDGR
jgi:hypothetical protein